MKSRNHPVSAAALAITCLVSVHAADGKAPEKLPEAPANGIIEKYHLLNPSQFPQALGCATQLEITARRLRQEETTSPGLLTSPPL